MIPDQLVPGYNAFPLGECTVWALLHSVRRLLCVTAPDRRIGAHVDDIACDDGGDHAATSRFLDDTAGGAQQLSIGKLCAGTWHNSATPPRQSDGAIPIGVAGQQRPQRALHPDNGGTRRCWRRVPGEA